MNSQLAKPLRYHLRFQIVPGPNVERDADALSRFCADHGVEEVVLFLAAEEWNNGLLSAAEEDLWFEAVATAKRVLDRAGIATSLNPWMTVLHTDRGRRLPPDRPFRPMESPLGEKTQACASFADPEWQRYVYNLYGRFARLGFRVLWVEDDFRFHNHAPLTWGGGFEPDVIERFERKTGQPTTREAVVSAILRPGEPHPWRAIWMETWRELHLEVARGISDAVERNAPGRSKLGLMSSHPSSHSIEGRDWRRLFGALSIGGQVAHRPHYAGYSEATGNSRDWSIMMLDVQRNFRPPEAEVAPEVENFPFTVWSKSDAQTWSEMALCMFYGSDALLLDLFPVSGNPADQEPRIGQLLDRSRPALEWISSRFAKDLRTRGIGAPWNQDAQAHVRTSVGKSMTELNATSFESGRLLLPYGVPVSANRQEANALFGTSAWSFSDDEVQQMLAGGLLLDGTAAAILAERGFEEQIGIEFRGWADRDTSTYAVELVVSDQADVPGGLTFNANLHPRMAVIEPRGGAREWTTISTPTRERVGAGIVSFENSLGGRTVVFAAPDPAGLPRSFHRQRITQSVVRFLCGGRAPFAIVTGGAYLMPIQFEADGKRFVVVYNGSPDPAKPVVRLDGERHDPAHLTILAPLAQPVEGKARTNRAGGGLVVESEADVPYHAYLVAEW